ncbi:Clp protease ClpP [Carnobacterium sp. PL12RED10]|uniref:head maturation protease, ClpP-related n=1 Tax=Carnobacterium sp. PL12RED10 TaxID=2592351 RepID=UPI0011F084C7|nr:head maturation protease, ClpP-related [Carnobacterium sp. PL12RED10]KAF3299333.1 Clp protease ClpP [Carnobacterium sp. PL12RED10]
MQITMNGVIVSDDDKWIYDYLDMSAFSPKELRQTIQDHGIYEPLNIEINSPGGYVNAGTEIYTMLLTHKGEVNITIGSQAASIASVIAMAGKRVAISPAGKMMIHNVSGQGGGDYRDMADYSDFLFKNNEMLANTYVLKTGKPKQELLDMMNAETWMNADEALENGFVDEILTAQTTEPDLGLVAGYNLKILTPERINEVKALYEEEQLALLELKGDVKI